MIVIIAIELFVEDYIRVILVLSQGDSAATGHSEPPERSSPDNVTRVTEAKAAGPSSGGGSRHHPCASGVAMTNYRGGFGWTERPERNLLFVIHPWCMLRKSDADRQSEFPPPGFLERLKAKLLALHCETDEQRRPQCPAAKRRCVSNSQRIKCWFQYTAAVAALQGAGSSRIKAIAADPGAAAGSGGGGVAAAGHGAACAGGYQAKRVEVADFLGVRRRYTAAMAEGRRGVNDC